MKICFSTYGVKSGKKSESLTSFSGLQGLVAEDGEEASIGCVWGGA